MKAVLKGETALVLWNKRLGRSMRSSHGLSWKKRYYIIRADIRQERVGGYGGIDGTVYNQLSDGVRQDLKCFSEGLKESISEKRC